MIIVGKILQSLMMSLDVANCFDQQWPDYQRCSENDCIFVDYVA